MGARMNSDAGTVRSMGLLGATGIGVGAIVGGGILALAGVAYAATGPSAVLAFALNGLIAFVTVLSFAEMSSTFPESGGTYTFAKKVLSVESAFTVGWVVWFASILAGVLYALGFASYALLVIRHLWRALSGDVPSWLFARWTETALATMVTALYTLNLIRKTGHGRQWETVGKVIVFFILIVGGFWALRDRPPEAVRDSLHPFFPFGAAGLFQAMGYTFIALQGFDLIAAVAGEVRDPGRTIPRAMLLALAAALVIYLPLLFLMATVGVTPGQSLTEMSALHPETMVAEAAKNFLGPFGFWLVAVAAILSMLSALHVNLLAASRVALTMARDRNFPNRLGRIHARGTPVTAVLASASLVCLILFLIPDVAAAGAVASLIFLVSFALAHWTAILARRRVPSRSGSFRVPLFPVVPAAGLLACVSLAVFQGVEVPTAGLIVGTWLAIGGILFLFFFARRARIFDASFEAKDPYLVRLRGRSPLVLVPIANPANAQAMVTVAHALATPEVGRVLLLSVVSEPDNLQTEELQRKLADTQKVLHETLTTSISMGLFPEALTTVAPQPWPEIIRVARSYRCACLLLGFSRLTENLKDTHLEELMSTVDCDVVILRAPRGWRLPEVRRVLVPVGGRSGHHVLRSRILGSLCRTGTREITFLQILAENASREARENARRKLARLSQDEVPGGLSRLEVARSRDVSGELIRHTSHSDLIILGLQRISRRRKVFGDFTLRIARETTCPIIMISRRG